MIEFPKLCSLPLAAPEAQYHAPNPTTSVTPIIIMEPITALTASLDFLFRVIILFKLKYYLSTIEAERKQPGMIVLRQLVELDS